MRSYYNEHDPKAAAWLRALIAAGHIPAGDVDERSILDVRPHEIDGYIQQHFFAGVAGWPLALRIAGWPDSRPVRTGSCPCQPFSQAGKRKGTEDERHLWPHFRDLITFGAPTVTFGEQVTSKDGRAWLAGIRADLEALGYAVGAADLCAASVGAPHIRQRLFWVGVPHCAGRESGRIAAASARHRRAAQSASGARRLGHADDPGSQGRGIGPDAEPCQEGREAAQRSTGLPGVSGGMAVTKGEREDSVAGGAREGFLLGDGHSAWNDFDLIPCGDGKARRVESGVEPLVASLPRGVVRSGDISIAEAQASGEARVMRLKGYGNSIVPPLAAEFIQAFTETLTV